MCQMSEHTGKKGVLACFVCIGMIPRMHRLEKENHANIVKFSVLKCLK